VYSVLQQTGRNINYIWVCPLVLVTIIILLFVEFGKSFGAGCSALIVLLILEIGIGLVVGKTR
jgi:paraquat-inducible protein B